MQTSTVSQTIVTITPVEVQQWVAAHMNVLTPSDAMPLQNVQIPGVQPRIAYLLFGATQDQLDGFLRSLISNLPAVGSYTFMLIKNSEDPNYGGARVIWKNS